MSYPNPYLPDVIEALVGRISVFFESREEDPFAVYFDKGNYAQVSKSVYSDGSRFPLVWLSMPFSEQRGKGFSVFADTTFDLVLAMPTSKDYTQQQRDDTTFKPRLIPIYDRIMYEMHADPLFQTLGPNKIKHTRKIRPYWGGGDNNTPGTPNLFKKYVDAITVENIQIPLNYSRPINLSLKP